MRYTGSVVEVADAVVVLRSVGRGEIIRATDVAVERRPKAEIVGDVITTARDATGRAARQPLRAGQPVHRGDLVKPELVRRDENVTLVFQVPGIMLTTRGKALEAGGEGDVISVLNTAEQSQRSGRRHRSWPGRNRHRRRASHSLPAGGRAIRRNAVARCHAGSISHAKWRSRRSAPRRRGDTQWLLFDRSRIQHWRAAGVDGDR